MKMPGVAGLPSAFRLLQKLGIKDRRIRQGTRKGAYGGGQPCGKPQPGQGIPFLVQPVEPAGGKGITSPNGVTDPDGRCRNGLEFSGVPPDSSVAILGQQDFLQSEPLPRNLQTSGGICPMGAELFREPSRRASVPW